MSEPVRLGSADTDIPAPAEKSAANSCAHRSVMLQPDRPRYLSERKASRGIEDDGTYRIPFLGN